jgi:NhaP-type Na+/H+ or K+/H+ antiporter
MAFGSTAGHRDENLMPFIEDAGGLVSLLVWLAFGAVAVAPAFTDLTWQTALYAGLSLTIIRMVPVALALAGSGLGRAATAFIGWFGPRGLASVVFGLLALEDLGHNAAEPAVTAIGVTVVLSVIIHGATADPLARRYGPGLTPAQHDAGAATGPPMPVRRLTRTATTPRP